MTGLRECDGIILWFLNLKSMAESHLPFTSFTIQRRERQQIRFQQAPSSCSLSGSSLVGSRWYRKGRQIHSATNIPGRHCFVLDAVLNSWCWPCSLSETGSFSLAKQHSPSFLRRECICLFIHEMHFQELMSWCGNDGFIWMVGTFLWKPNAHFPETYPAYEPSYNTWKGLVEVHSVAGQTITTCTLWSLHRRGRISQKVLQHRKQHGCGVPDAAGK